MIMVGLGTGAAPFRGFLQERAALKQQGVPVGESLLFFGCRDPLQDFLYKDEMRAFEAAGGTKLHTTFSREPGKPKTYVQQAIQAQSEDVWRLLQQGAVIFACGDAPAWRRMSGRRSPVCSKSAPALRKQTPRPGSPAWWRSTATSRTSGRPLRKG